MGVIEEGGRPGKVDTQRGGDGAQRGARGQKRQVEGEGQEVGQVGMGSARGRFRVARNEPRTQEKEKSLQTQTSPTV